MSRYACVCIRAFVEVCVCVCVEGSIHAPVPHVYRLAGIKPAGGGSVPAGQWLTLSGLKFNPGRGLTGPD